jgi:hypothetical protein
VTTSRTILAAIVIEIMLAVMLFTLDMAALHILSMVQALTFAVGNHPIGLGATLHALDMPLTTIQTGGLALGQTPGSNPLINPPLLTDLALINAGRCRLGMSKQRQRNNHSSHKISDFHFTFSFEHGIRHDLHLTPDTDENHPGKCKGL